jgi:hypothetical protein
MHLTLESKLRRHGNSLDLLLAQRNVQTTTTVHLVAIKARISVPHAKLSVTWELKKVQTISLVWEKLS